MTLKKKDNSASKSEIGSGDRNSGRLLETLDRSLVFIHGKGGVGKTVVSQAVALEFAKKGEKTLWVTLEDPTRPEGELRQVNPHLWHLNTDFSQSFEEYAAMKIGIPKLTRLFLGNKVIRYLAKAAPGIHELVLLGKIWFERTHYEHVIVDLPSTGYGLAMFQSTENFARLFKGGPLYRDAEKMLGAFRDPLITGHVIVATPEEMPLRESLELEGYLRTLFPKNPAAFIANRLFPTNDSGDNLETANLPDELPPNSWASPLASSPEDYIKKRLWLENYNLRLWRDEGIEFARLSYVIPPPLETPPQEGFQKIIQELAHQLQTRGYLAKGQRNT